MTDNRLLVEGLELVSEGVAKIALAFDAPEGAKAATRLPSPAIPEVPPAEDYEEAEFLADLAFDTPAPKPPAAARKAQDATTVLSECPDHQRPWRPVPGGVSKKTGRPYKAFWVCQEKSCERRPSKAWSDSHDANLAAIA